MKSSHSVRTLTPQSGRSSHPIKKSHIVQIPRNYPSVFRVIGLRGVGGFSDFASLNTYPIPAVLRKLIRDCPETYVLLLYNATRGLEFQAVSSVSRIISYFVTYGLCLSSLMNDCLCCLCLCSDSL